jgi:hypothetical protein
MLRTAFIGNHKGKHPLGNRISGTFHNNHRWNVAVLTLKRNPHQSWEFLATCPATTRPMEACGGSHFMARKL